MGLVGWPRPDVWSAASGGADTESHVRDGRRRAPFSPTAATLRGGARPVPAPGAPRGGVAGVADQQS